MTNLRATFELHEVCAGVLRRPGGLIHLLPHRHSPSSAARARPQT